MKHINDGWIKTTCAYCGVGCGVEARPNMKGQLEIRGDKEHPANYGKLCTKGIALGETVITDGRLLSPILNTSLGKEILDWNTATDIVANKFRQTIEEFGKDSVAFYVSGQLLTEDYYLANKLIKGFIGTGNIDSNSRLCMASSVVGHKRAFGTDTVPVCYEDIEKSDLVILVGSNLAWCHPVIFQRLRIAKQNNPRLKVIVVDPRESETCSIADLHLPIKSGGDVALFNGLLSYLDESNNLDQSFINSHTNEFEQALASANCEKNIEINTGLSHSQLLEFYEHFISTEKVITVYSQGVNQSTSGSDKVNSIINCHLATGKIGKIGTGPFSVTGQPNAMGGREVGALANTLASHMEFDNAEHTKQISEFWETDNLASKPGLKAVDMFNAIEEGKIKAIWVMATNPVVSLPNSDKIKAALKRCPFVVVSDCIEDTETTRLADLVLPAQGWSEKSGTVTNSERRISRQRRVMPSPGLAKPDWWIINQVARKMGYAKSFNYRHEGEIFSEYAQLSTIGNLNNERDFTLIGLTNLDDSGYSELTPQQWPVLELQHSPVNQRMFSDSRFFTPNNRANFIACRYHAPKSQVSNTYPMLLNSGRSRDQWHTMSRTGLSASLADHTPEPYVLINEKSAHTHNISQGQRVKLTSSVGSCEAKAKITSEISENQLFMPIHWTNITAKNSKPCSLIGPQHDSMSGQPEFKHTPVSIEPLHTLSSAVFLTRTTINLNQFDYWSRQKISSGYLYRIESMLPIEELHQLLVQIENSHDEKVLSFDSHSGKRVIAMNEESVNKVIQTANELASIDVFQLIDIFEQPIDELNQESILDYRSTTHEVA